MAVALMVSALDSRAYGPGSSPGKTLNSHGASLHPGVEMDIPSIPSRGG